MMTYIDVYINFMLEVLKLSLKGPYSMRSKFLLARPSYDHLAMLDHVQSDVTGTIICGLLFPVLFTSFVT